MIKELIQKYKKLKIETTTVKEYTAPKVETVNLEREFPIEIIASTMENRALAPLEDLEDFWSFITNEEVSLSNIQRFIPIIQREILNQYPNFKILDLSSDEWYLKEDKVKWLKNWYREQNGVSLTIKSLKKGYTKTLTIQDK